MLQSLRKECAKFDQADALLLEMLREPFAKSGELEDRLVSVQKLDLDLIKKQVKVIEFMSNSADPR